MQRSGLALKQSASLPLGVPIENTFAVVLDSEMNPVPCGVEGELYIGGAGVARGYDGRSALTAERFVADPFNAGERLYRSGDKVRQLRDGSLVFLGRIDDQIKVRGYRVEPDEVRAAILAHTKVRDAAVIVAQSNDGRNQLHAFLVPQLHSRVDIDAVKSALVQTLPDYMVPARIELLDELPLTANGKLDRKALLATPSQDEAQPIELPHGMYEESVANIWKDLLRIDQIGRGDNFFALGGDSVLGLKLIARIRRTVPGGEQFAMTDLMQTATLSELAARLQNQLEHGHDAVCLNAGGTGIPLYCLPGLICNTREFTSLARALQDDRPVYTFVSHVYTRNRWRGFSIEALAAEYASFIKATAPAKRCALLGWSSGGDLAIEVARQLQGSVEIDFLGMLDVFETEPLCPQFDLTDAQKREADAQLNRWLAASTMSSHWQALLARMDDIERKFVAEQLLVGESLPLDGDGDEAHEYLLWTTLDKRMQATRYEYPRLSVPIHVFHAEKSLSSDGVLRDWSISSTIAAVSTIPQASHLDIIHHPELHSQIRNFIRLAESGDDVNDDGSKH
jgi:thioesterase domain-containing protein